MLCLSLCPVSPSLCYLMVQPAGTDFSVQTVDSLTSLRELLHTQTWLEGLWVVLRWLSLSSVTAPLQSFREVWRSRAEGWGPGSCCSRARCRSQRIWRVRKRGWGVVAGWLTASGAHSRRWCGCLGWRWGVREGFGCMGGGSGRGWRRRRGSPGWWRLMSWIFQGDGAIIMFSLWEKKRRTSDWEVILTMIGWIHFKCVTRC